MDEQVVGPDLVLTTETEGDRAVIAIKGELDAYTAPGVEEQIANLVGRRINNIVLDLSETGFLDSSGLRAILTAHRRLASEEGSLTLRTPERTGDAPARDHGPHRPLPHRRLTGRAPVASERDTCASTAAADSASSCNGTTSASAVSTRTRRTIPSTGTAIRSSCRWVRSRRASSNRIRTPALSR